MSLHNRKTVLFITSAEAGQSNSIFALALELLAHPNIDVHVASFPALRKRAEESFNSIKVVKTKHLDSSFTFQEIGGQSLQEAVRSKQSWTSAADFPHPPLARTHDDGLSKLVTLRSGWDGKGTTRRHFWLFSPPIQLEYPSLTDMGTVCFRIRQSG